MEDCISKEVLCRKQILRDNALAEMKLHKMAGRGGDCTRTDLASNPPTQTHLSKPKGKLLVPFLQARTCTCLDEQILKTIGKPKDV